ncbi:MAG: hypothetical protein AAGN46_01435 [Acidobacteriota bacterium]
MQRPTAKPIERVTAGAGRHRSLEQASGGCQHPSRRSLGNGVCGQHGRRVEALVFLLFERQAQATPRRDRRRNAETFDVGLARRVRAAEDVEQASPQVERQSPLRRRQRVDQRVGQLERLLVMPLELQLDEALLELLGIARARRCTVSAHGSERGEGQRQREETERGATEGA